MSDKTQEDIISHYGIKGMKWGVRRYQNSDGSLTAAGKERDKYRRNIIRNRPYVDDVNDIVRSLNKKDAQLLETEFGKDFIDKENQYDYLPNLAKTVVEKYNGIPVSFAQIWTNGGKVGEMALATRSGDDYRGKGHASKAVKRVLDWVEKNGNRSIDSLVWSPRTENAASIRLAKKFGFEYKETKDGHDFYVKDLRKNNR